MGRLSHDAGKLNKHQKKKVDQGNQKKKNRNCKKTYPTQIH
jgi:hypothetical protein